MLVNSSTEVIVIGAGFTGLSIAYELAKSGIAVTVLEESDEIGGLAAAFDVGGAKLDRFYHHWFTNDSAVMDLIAELNITDRVEINPTNTGIYYANNFFKLSSPWDLLKFKPLSFTNRIRLGLLALKARRVKNWIELEDKTAEEWLCELGGKDVYKVIWQPLLAGKFGPFASQISAVWFWNKLKLRGGSRGKRGEERLAYFKGGFIALATALSKRITELGGKIELSNRVVSLNRAPDGWTVSTQRGMMRAIKVVSTLALPLTADLLPGDTSPTYIAKLRRIAYIGNVCLVLELDRQLSSTYWLNVNEPGFPFVGIIEHTNFESAANYSGRHIVYLSKYLPHTDQIYSMTADEFLAYAIPYLQQMFPQFGRSWILNHHLWRARWSQPIVEKKYSSLIPSEDSPLDGLHICSMAQIYPEDRGTNYAIKAGKKLGVKLTQILRSS